MRVASETVHLAAPAGSAWWLHVDLDGLSTADLPAVDYPQDGGLSWFDLADFTGAALSIGGGVGATITIYNPDLDPERRHARMIVELIGSVAEGLEAQAWA